MFISQIVNLMPNFGLTQTVLKFSHGKCGKSIVYCSTYKYIFIQVVECTERIISETEFTDNSSSCANNTL